MFKRMSFDFLFFFAMSEKLLVLMLHGIVFHSLGAITAKGSSPYVYERCFDKSEGKIAVN